MRESKAVEAMREARGALLLTNPFFGVLSLKLALVEDAGIKAAIVDSKQLRFNSEYVLNLPNAKRKGLWARRVMHLSLQHHTRQGARDPELWNQACELAVNPMLIAEGFELPDGALIDPKHTGKSAESIYSTLREEKQDEAQKAQKPKPDQNAKPESGAGQGKPQPGQGGQPQPGKAGPSDPNGTPQPGPQGAGQGQGQPEPFEPAFDPAGPEGSAENGESAREWQENTAEAMRAASGAGKMPGGLKLTMQAAIAPKAGFEDLLKRFANDQIKTKSTWSKRNKRFTDIYMPGKVNDGMGPMAIVIDTSGSVVKALNRFGAAISEVIEDLEPSQVYVIYADSKVNHVDVFEHGETVKLNAHGGGGTRFKPAFDYLEREAIVPVALIYLTDLDSPDLAKLQDPGFPVLWAGYQAGNRKGPIGETIYLD